MPESDEDRAARAAPITYLIGLPGVGKLTVARALAARTGATIVDNHSINNPIFRLIDTDGKAPLPPEVWQRVGEVGRAVYETIATLSPKDLRFVLTNYLADTPDEAAFFREIAGYAERRGSLLLVVRLECAPWAHRLRVVNPSRKRWMKAMDPDEVLRLGEEKGVLRPEHPYVLEVDTTEMRAEEVAERILEWERGVVG